MLQLSRKLCISHLLVSLCNKLEWVGVHSFENNVYDPLEGGARNRESSMKYLLLGEIDEVGVFGFAFICFRLLFIILEYVA